MLLFNIPYMAAKIGLINLGYKMGVKAISVLSESTKIISFSNNCRNFRGGRVDSEECTINDNFCFRLKTLS